MCFVDFDPAEFVRSYHPRARKPYLCGECRGAIPAGATYTRIVGRWEGEFWTFTVCDGCEALRESVHTTEMQRGCDPRHAWAPYGGLEEAIKDGGYGLIPGRLGFHRRQRAAQRTAA